MNVIKEFEEEFRKFTDSEHAIACCNGTSALHTALLSLGIVRGDKVITTPFSFIASSNCILYVGATPVFADIGEDYCISPNEVAIQLDKHPDAKAILCVHLFGNVCRVDKLLSLSHGFSIPLIEDCAQAFGAKYGLAHVGNFGEFGTFSFYLSKNLWTFEGGMLITNSEDLAEKARLIINHGRSEKNLHTVLGYNYRMPEPCALQGLTMLKRHKKAVMAELGSYGPKEGYYPRVIYDQPLYKKLGIKGNCPNAEKVASMVRRWRRDNAI